MTTLFRLIYGYLIQVLATFDIKHETMKSESLPPKTLSATH